MNERLTEQIARNFLRDLDYYIDDSLIVEEQQSQNPRVSKLLKQASKQGNGPGYPEFIIRSKQHSNFIIIIECKADILKHESVNLDNYKDYAVDGALLYASYLAKEFDVLAIGISGETIDEINVSHYLYLKGTDEYHEFLGDEILSFYDYYKSYIESPKKFNKDYSMLLSYSQDLNDLLHDKKIKESQRSLLISGILIALQNNAFIKSYKEHRKAGELAKSLVDTIASELNNSDLESEKIKNLKHAFSFIRTHTTLSNDKQFLENLIDSIDNKVNSFIKTYKYFDTLGQFYIEFLRYANHDKGLGIILTPPHITELFSDLANVDTNSVILDNCCGTGGFLISALKSMIIDSKGNSKKVEDIKKEQIIGIEYQDDIYALAVSNMIIHGDGKSNIFQGDCFKNVSKVRTKYNPNVGFLNPPYKVTKNDTEELKFVLNNLEMLEKNGKCVAIVPMRCALAQRGKTAKLKEKIFENHTLEAVMSMPDELFYNSDVSVVTCVMVFTAHKPHPEGKETWFGYWKDDGFIKVKNKGRIDDNNEWEKIKHEWISTFRNKKVKSGYSIMQEVNAKDEWAAEAYMETDYSKLTKDDFEEVIKNYVAHHFLDSGD